MEKVINIGIPHVGEQIFENIDTDGLIECLKVSETWKILAENVLLKRWNSQMFEACESGKAEIVKLLLERVENNNLNAIQTSGKFEGTAFVVACQNGHNEVIQLLLDLKKDKNVEFDARNRDGCTTFCAFGHKDVVQLILDHAIDRNIRLNVKDENEGTPFMLACQNGHKNIVQLFLQYSENRNIDLNARDNDGRTAFMWACQNGHTDIVKLFLHHSEVKLNCRCIIQTQPLS